MIAVVSSVEGLVDSENSATKGMHRDGLIRKAFVPIAVHEPFKFFLLLRQDQRREAQVAIAANLQKIAGYFFVAVDNDEGPRRVGIVHAHKARKGADGRTLRPSDSGGFGKGSVGNAFKLLLGEILLRAGEVSVRCDSNHDSRQDQNGNEYGASGGQNDPVPVGVGSITSSSSIMIIKPPSPTLARTTCSSSSCCCCCCCCAGSLRIIQNSVHRPLL